MRRGPPPTWRTTDRYVERSSSEGSRARLASDRFVRDRFFQAQSDLCRNRCLSRGKVTGPPFGQRSKLLHESLTPRLGLSEVSFLPPDHTSPSGWVRNHLCGGCDVAGGCRFGLAPEPAVQAEEGVIPSESGLPQTMLALERSASQRSPRLSTPRRRQTQLRRCWRYPNR